MADKAEAARRLMEGLVSVLRGFIIDSSLEDPRPFMEVVRGAGIGSLVTVSRIGGSELHVIRVNAKPCASRCRYEECVGGGSDCMERCVERCVEERVRQIVDRLEATYIGSRQPRIRP